MRRPTPKRETPVIEDFFSDDGSLFVRVGDLQVASETISRIRQKGADESSIRFLEELIPRIERSCLLLLRLIEDRL